MRARFYQNVKRMNARVFVGTAIVLAVVLTTGMNLFFAWISGAGIRPMTMLFATIDAIVIPAILAPIFFNIVKRSANLEELNRQLEREIAKRQHAEQSAERRAANLQAISDLAVECAAASPDTDLTQLIADKLRSITGALAVSIGTFEAQTQALTTRHIAVSGQMLSAVNEILGRNIIGLRSPVSPEMLKRMLTEVVSTSEDLSETTFGAISRPVAAAIQKAFGIGSFTGLAFSYGGELWGASVIVSRTQQPPIDRELALALANISAVALRRQKAEQALRHEKQLSDDIINGLPGLFFMYDEQARLVRWNNHHGQLLGYSADELAHMRATDFAAESEKELVVARMRQVFAEGEADLDAAVMTKTGQPIPFHLIGRRTVLDGKAYLLGFGVDMTEREKLVAQLQAKNTELEQFTYTVSHDLRSPLITVRGFMSLLEKDTASGNAERVKSDIARIMEATGKMQRLLEELLELSRIGRMMNPPHVVPFETIAREAVELVRGRIEARGVQVEVAQGLPTVYGDRTRLVQVVQNLVDNAIKFMGSQPRPYIEIGQTTADHTVQPVFFVRDNGIGLDPKFHDQVFGLFNKLDAQIEGTGVGLALVKRIIEVHGGRIWVESGGPGKGSVFYFTLSQATVTFPGG